MSQFQLQHSDGRVTVTQHENMDQSCLVSMVQADGVRDIFLAHYGSLSSLVTIQVLLPTTSIPLWPHLVSSHLTMATSSKTMHHVTNLKSSQTDFLKMTMRSLFSAVTRSWYSREPLGCGVMGDSHHRYAANKSAAITQLLQIWCQYGPKCVRNVANTLVNLCHE